MMNFLKKEEEFDIFSKKPLYTISIIDRCIVNVGKTSYTVSASECIKWLSIHNMETIPHFPNTTIPFHKKNRMKCYFIAKDYYEEQLVKDDDLITCLTKVWHDEMYRNDPLQIINFYYRQFYGNQAIEHSNKITKEQLEFIIHDIQTKVKKKYFV